MAHIPAGITEPGGNGPQYANPYPAAGQATIDAPKFNKEGTELQLEARSVKTIEHAWNICKTLESNNRTRAARTADIQSIHDGAPPRSGADNALKAKAWQSNASTNWLSGVVGRQAQRFVTAITTQTYLTFSRLPTSFSEAKAKSDLMQSKFTSLVRGWNGYTGMINSISVEDVLQGYTYAVFLDPYTWKPTMFKQDRFYVPEQSGQHARDLQFCVAKMDYRLDEFLELFRNESAAEEIGYDLKNCLFAANRATMEDPRDDATTTQFRNLVEMINEGIIGLTYTGSGARVVNCWLLFNREYDGQVSFWLIERDTGKLLRFSFKLFKKMEDILAMFSFEPGNGCIHSSKGLGRKLANLAIMKELFRNGIIDNSRLSGLMVIQVDPKDRNRLAPMIMSPFVVLDKTISVSQTQFNVSAESYQTVDNLTDRWSEQAVGAYISQQLDDKGRGDKTATEATIDARREAESSNIQIRRWLDNWATLTQIQQKRAFSDDNIDQARRMVEEITKDPTKNKPSFYEGHANMDPEVLLCLVEIMAQGQITDDEIKVWRDTPASIYAHVSEAAVQQGLAMVIQQYGADPTSPLDATLAKARDIENKVGAELAAELLIPGVDKTLLAEQAAMQLNESSTMYSIGVPVPVSLRNNHIIHGGTIKTMLTEIASPVLSKNPNPPQQLMKAIELNLNHLGEHLAAATQLGQNNTPAFADLDKFYKGFKKQLEEVIQIQAQAQAAQESVKQKVREEDGLAQPEGPTPIDAPDNVPGPNLAPQPGSLPATAAA